MSRARILLLSAAAIACLTVLSAPEARAAGEDPCLGCHEDKTPGVVAYWRDSAHYAAGVTCVRCHGKDKKKSHDQKARVDAEACGSCHRDELKGHRSSRHALGMRTGQGCTRNMPASREQARSCGHCHERGSTKPIVDSQCAMFLAQSPEMQRQGCSSCHRVEDRCDTCHTKHGTDTALAARAETCGVCHMGPDHAQLEMWRTSVHGAIFGEEAGAVSNTPAAGPGAPTCVTCHMDGGSHDVSQGIATGRPAPRRERDREFMLGICQRCHTRNMAERSLEDADRIELQSRELVDEARGIVEALDREGLLMPEPEAREAHPLFGKSLVTGPHMLYEGLSSVEAKYFRMKMFYYMSAFKGAFHQNPDHAHWYGNAPLKLALSEIKSEAAMLRQLSALQRRVDNMALTGLGNSSDESQGLKRALRELNERLYRREMTEEEHRLEKKRLLDSMGL